jgi:outer membrane lipoprotein
MRIQSALVAVLILLFPFLLGERALSAELEVLTNPSPESSPTFSEIRADPNAYQGREVTLGGEVITVRRYEDTTQIEVLELPLSDRQEPRRTQGNSEGRFLAFQPKGLDPKALPLRSRVTVIGQVVGSAVTELEQGSYTYPVIEIKSLIVWPNVTDGPPRPSPYPGSTSAELAPQTQPPATENTSLTPAPYAGSFGYGFSMVIERYYYSPYWDPLTSAWSWRPFWVYPWWIFHPRPVIVVPKPIVVVPIVPRAHPPKELPWRFREHQARPVTVTPPTPTPPAPIIPAPATSPPMTVSPQFRMRPEAPRIHAAAPLSRITAPPAPAHAPAFRHAEAHISAPAPRSASSRPKRR